MNRKPFIAANWKMNLNRTEAQTLLRDLSNISVKDSEYEIVICVPFPYLLLATEQFQGSQLQTGSQDCSSHAVGAYTGETSAAMIRSCNANYTLLGHSERRRYHGEKATELSAKIREAHAAQLKIIFCVGETLEEREQKLHFNCIHEQIGEVASALQELPLDSFVIAYEPVWAIGTGKTASPETAQEMHAYIRNVLKNSFSTAPQIRIIYGGSCTPENAAALFKQPDIDGALVGGASLNAASFKSIIHSY